MKPRTGAGGAAVLLAALFPAACLKSVVLEPPDQKSGTGGNGGISSTDGGGLDGGDVGAVMCPNGPGSALRLSHANPTVIFAVDHSSSMMTTHLSPNSNASRLSVVQGVLKDLLGRYASRTNAGYQVNFGYLEFPQVQQGRSCPSNGCCVGNVYLNGQNSIQNAIDRCATPSSSGSSCLPQADATSTTTVDALEAVSRTFQGLASTDPQKITVLLTDHQPADCSGSNQPCGDASTVIARLNNSLNVATYVVAVGDNIASDPDASACVDLMAGPSKARHPGSLAYYTAINENQVRQNMTTPVTSALCYAQIEDNNFDPNRPLLVDIDGQMIPRDPTHANGWDIDDLRNGHQGIMFFGAACENAFLANQFQQVHATVCGR